MPDPQGCEIVPVESLLASTRDLLVRLTRLLGLDVSSDSNGVPGSPWGAAVVPAHLSFSAVPAMLSEAWGLCERSAHGGVADRFLLADWFGRVDVLSAAVETLHAAGALPVDIVVACRSSTAEGQALANDWAAWARAAACRPEGVHRR